MLSEMIREQDFRHIFSSFSAAAVFVSRRKSKRNRNILVSRDSKIEAVKVETAANGEGLNSNCMIISKMIY